MSDRVSDVRDAALAEAERWLGTPYRHQASVRGAGCDCLGLVRGVWRAVVGPERRAVPPYTPDWARERGEETLLDAASEVLVETADAQPGDVLAFRLSPGAPVTHLGILAGSRTLIHAYARRSVVRTPLGPWWRRRHSHSFRFPAPQPEHGETP